MSTPIVFNGVAYSVPAYNDTGYAQGAGNLSSYLIAIATGTLQQSGGTFSLTADVNFGNNFGLVSKYYKSVSANIATAGVVRLANSDTIDWKNFLGSGNLALSVNSSDQLVWDGAVVTTGSAAAVQSLTGTANQIIVSSPTGNVTVSTPQDIATSSSPTFSALTLGQSGLVLKDAASSWVTVKAPTSAPSNYAVILPTAQGAANTTFVNDGSGNLSYSLLANANIASAAAIAVNKLAALTASSPVRSSASGFLTTGATDLSTSDVTGNLGVTHLNSGTAASSGTFWRGDGTWAAPSGSGTVNAGTSTHLAYYATSTDAVSDGSGNTISGTYTWSGVNTYSAQDVHSAGISITGLTGGSFINATTTQTTDVSGFLINTNNANAGAGCFLGIQSGGASGGDPYQRFTINGVQSWALGIDNSSSDAFCINTGSTLDVTNSALSIRVSDSAVAIKGTSTNDSAAAGFVGEYVSSAVTSVNFPTSTQFGDLTSITLPNGGDWDVSLNAFIFYNGATVTSYNFGISTTTGNSSTGLAIGDNETQDVSGAGATQQSRSIPAWRLSISGTTIVYAKFSANYSVATPQGYGRLSARRVR